MMIGLGAVKLPDSPPAQPSGGGGFFPNSEPQNLPAPEDRTVMRQAAELWAQTRRRGAATVPDPALDGDVILAAQAVILGSNTIIATDPAIHSLDRDSPR